MHGGNSFLPTSMFTKKIKLGNEQSFFSHNLFENFDLVHKFFFSP
jgi:hypothetical protein